MLCSSAVLLCGHGCFCVLAPVLLSRRVLARGLEGQYAIRYGPWKVRVLAVWLLRLVGFVVVVVHHVPDARLPKARCMTSCRVRTAVYCMCQCPPPSL